MNLLQVPFLVALLLPQNTVVAVEEDECSVKPFALTDVREDFGAVEGFYDIAQWIAKRMQASMDEEFYQKISDLINEKENESEVADHVLYIIKREPGAIAFLVIGAVFVVGLPISGLIFCCCRFAGNCGAGGKNPRKERTCSKISLPFYLLFLVIGIVIIVVGTIIYCNGVRNTNNNIEGVFEKSDRIIKDISRVLTDAAFDVSCHGLRTSDSLFSNIESTVRRIPNQTFEEFKSNYGYYSMERIMNMRDELGYASSNAVTATGKALDSVNTLVGIGQYSDERLKELRTQLKEANLSLSLLSQNIDKVYGEVQPVYREVKAKLDETSEKIESAVNQSSEALNTAHDGIKKLLEDVNKTVGDINEKVRQFNNDIKEIADDFINFSGRDALLHGARALVLVPCALVIIPATVVLVFGLLRVCQNVFCMSCLSCFTSVGGYIAVFGITCAFVFGWIVMLVASIVFAGGFSVETACYGLFRDEQLNLLNYLDVFNFNIYNQYTDKKIDIHFGEVLRSCESGSSIFRALNGSEIMDEKAIIGQANLEKYRDDAIRELEKYPLNFTFSESGTITLNETYAQLLVKFNEINFDLANITATGNVNKAKTDLKEARSAASITLSLIGTLISNLDNVIQGANKSPDFVKVGSEIIYGTFNTTADDIESHIRSAKEELLRDTYDCSPVYNIWQNVGIMTCDTVGRPVQGMWAAAGLAAIFLILVVAMLAVISGILYQRHSSSRKVSC